MGSGAEAAQETVEFLNARGEKVGILKVRLFRPFAVRPVRRRRSPPPSKAIAVLDRTKEPGSAGEPLYQDVITAIVEGLRERRQPFKTLPKVIGGRYGLSSKEFTPAMVKAVFDELKKPQPKNHFTVGINDDVTHTSLEYDASFTTEGPEVVRAMFYGLGADGTVGANKNSIKIIGEDTRIYAQGYFVYDSKKSGSTTVSHLRFGPRPIHSTYLVDQANFVACHQWFFLEKFDVLRTAVPGTTFLLNSIYGPDEVWDKLPRHIQKQIIDKKIKFYVIDGYKVAQATGMGGRVNTIMQTCFFAISGVLPRDEAIEAIKESIKKTYGKKGDQIVKQNYAAVDQTLENLHEVKVPAQVTSTIEMPPAVSDKAPEFVKRTTAADHGRVRRRAARERHADGRHVPDGYRAVGEAEHRPRDPGVGRGHLHPVQQVRDRLPARHHPGEGVRFRADEGRPEELQGGRLSRTRVQGDEVRRPGGPRGLHRVRPVRRRLSGKEQERNAAEGHQHDAAAAHPRTGGRQLRLLPEPAGSRPDGASRPIP